MEYKAALVGGPCDGWIITMSESPKNTFTMCRITLNDDSMHTYKRTAWDIFEYQEDAG